MTEKETDAKKMTEKEFILYTVTPKNLVPNTPKIGVQFWGVGDIVLNTKFKGCVNVFSTVI